MRNTYMILTRYETYMKKLWRGGGDIKGNRERVKKRSWGLNGICLPPMISDCYWRNFRKENWKLSWRLLQNVFWFINLRSFCLVRYSDPWNFFLLCISSPELLILGLYLKLKCLEKANNGFNLANFKYKHKFQRIMCVFIMPKKLGPLLGCPDIPKTPSSDF